MAERYTRVFAFNDSCYAESSPVIVQAGAILKDHKEGRLLAQMKFKNVSPYPSNIKALSVRITQYDVSDNELGAPVDFQYLDISIPREGEFGAKTPVVLTEINTRKISVTITGAVYEDGHVDQKISSAYVTVKPQKTLEEALGNFGLAEQFRRQFGRESRYTYEENKYLWLCPCGATNHKNEPECHRCGIVRAGVAVPPDLDALRREMEAYHREQERQRQEREARERALEEQRKRQKELERKELEKIRSREAQRQTELARAQREKAERIAAEKRKKLTRYISAIAVVVIVLCWVLFGWLPSRNASIYDEAQALMHAGSFEEALEQFERISSYEEAGTYADYCREAVDGDYRSYIQRFDVSTFTIPDGTTQIIDSAFEDCTTLTGVTIPDSMTSIGSRAFAGCSNLTGITIPDSVTSIGGFAFEYCFSLTNIVIPSGTVSIGMGTFHSCDNLTGVTLSPGVREIGDEAFKNCGRLESMELPESITHIGAGAFWDCVNLTSVTIPGGITSIEASTFRNCQDLESVVIPKGVTSIGNYAFLSCISLKDITFPESLTSIGNAAFQYSVGPESIT
ncbi:MAG: leucine-rich repeat protein, partial [Clostridia bacterium]|nr:leucine-rich repeat protein [Clostridia bacterium]